MALPTPRLDPDFEPRIPGPSWNDQDLYIIGGGTSLKGYDMSGLHEKGRVLGINRAPDLVPCHACFSIDQIFIREYAKQAEAWAASGMEVVFAPGPSWFDAGEKRVPGVRYIRRVQGTGIHAGVGTVINGLNSGYSGLCYGILKGATRIFLLGFDMKGGNDHWHGGYEWKAQRTAIYFPRWADLFHNIRRECPEGVEIFNCNPLSGINAFPFLSYRDIGLPLEGS